MYIFLSRINRTTINLLLKVSRFFHITRFFVSSGKYINMYITTNRCMLSKFKINKSVTFTRSLVFSQVPGLSSVSHKIITKSYSIKEN